MNKLVTLAVHNKQRYAITQPMRSNRPNGIACPECGQELVDPTPDIMLMSCPAQLDIKCMSCNFTGYRLA
jgi:hypothetical protein